MCPRAGPTAEGMASAGLAPNAWGLYRIHQYARLPPV